MALMWIVRHTREVCVFASTTGERLAAGGSNGPKEVSFLLFFSVFRLSEVAGSCLIGPHLQVALSVACISH